MVRALSVALALTLCLALSGPGHARPLTYQRLESSGVRWLPGDTVWSQNDVLQNRRQQLLDPGRRAEVMNELKQQPRLAGPQLRKAMYHAMLSTMRSDLPAAKRAAICQQLSRQFGEFAREVRRVPGMPVDARVSFGRVAVRFLRDDILMQEMAREREQQHHMKRAVQLSGLAAKPTKGSSTAPTKLEWQVPDPVDRSKLKSGPVDALTYSMSGYRKSTITALQRYDKQARRWRLVQSHSFSPAFVEKQRKAMDEAKASLESMTRHKTRSVPRLMESKLLQAFVWPRSPVKAARVAKNPTSVQVVDPTPIWKVNKQGIEVRPTRDGLHLDATFETAIKNEAVLKAFKSAIETVWNGQIRVKGKANQRLHTTVRFRKVGSTADFSKGSLRLLEGSSNCASQNAIELSRCFSSTTPAHEFGHILGLRDTYRSLYDPRARTFVEVQDRRTLMGSRDAPATCDMMTSACKNVLAR